MTEHEYEEWFDIKLGDTESLDKPLPTDSPFIFAPKPLKRSKWAFLSMISFSGCLLGSYLMAYIYNITNLWIWNWLSNLLLNFSIGLIASVVIMFYTNARDKNISFYTDIIPKIEKRIESLRSAYNDHSFKLQIGYQRKDFQSAYEAWQISSNTCLVILGYIRFLFTMLPVEVTTHLPNSEQLDKVRDQLLAANRKIQEEFFANGVFSEETCNECVRMVNWGMYALNHLDRFLATISSSLYGLKYSERSKKKPIKIDCTE